MSIYYKITIVNLAPLTILQATLSFLVTVLPLAYVCKGKLSLFFRNIKRKDIKVILLCLVGYYIYALIISRLMLLAGFTPHSNAILSSSMDITVFIAMLIQLVGEELFKIILLLLIMGGVYSLTNNRKSSLVTGVIVAMLVFGLLHFKAYNGALAQILLIIGIGSIFDIYVYLKTKNVFASYIMHVLVDAIPFIYFAVFHAMGA